MKKLYQSWFLVCCLVGVVMLMRLDVLLSCMCLKINIHVTRARLQELLDNPFFDYLPKPNNMTYDQYRALIKSKIKKWDDGAEQRNKEYEAQRKKRLI